MSERCWTNSQELDRPVKFYSGNDITCEHHSLENEFITLMTAIGHIAQHARIEQRSRAR